MVSKNIKALNASIKKWERKLRIVSSGVGKTIETGRISHHMYILEKEKFSMSWTDCPLCKLYIDVGACDCGGCPIANYSKVLYCNDTPYRLIVDYLKAHGHVITTKLVRLFEKEVEFLKKVRDKEVKNARLAKDVKHA